MYIVFCKNKNFANSFVMLLERANGAMHTPIENVRRHPPVSKCDAEHGRFSALK